MLIMGNISGIQDFLFDVRESGGKQAVVLRFRSLRLQLIVECIARRVLWTLDLPESDRLLYCAAGKFAIDASGAKDINTKLGSIRSDIEQWLLAQAHGRLRCAIIAGNSVGNAGERHDAANTALQRVKLRPWATDTWTARPLAVPAIFDRDAENRRDVNMVGKLRNASVIALTTESDAGSEPFAGVTVQFTHRKPEASQRGRSFITLERIARHTPKDASGQQVEFLDLAGRSRGAPMLGVLKADADSLGLAIRQRLGGSPDFKALRDFSQKLDRFFGATLDKQMSAMNSRWNNIYTVFAGGDDLLLVGPWDVIIDFAAHVREQFLREFSTDKLTLSGGCAIVKPKFPIRLGARQAEELLERSKTGPKDQFAVLGDVWRWNDHARIIDTGRQLADWADAGDIQRGWLHTVLELVLLQRSQSNSRDSTLIPEMASSRLHYHVARNWPKANEMGEQGKARQWIDTVLRHFDTFSTTTDPNTKYLPAILRYAILATRGKGDSDE